MRPADYRTYLLGHRLTFYENEHTSALACATALLPTAQPPNDTVCVGGSVVGNSWFVQANPSGRLVSPSLSSITHHYHLRVLVQSNASHTVASMHYLMYILLSTGGRSLSSMELYSSRTGRAHVYTHPTSNRNENGTEGPDDGIGCGTFYNDINTVITVPMPSRRGPWRGSSPCTNQF